MRYFIHNIWFSGILFIGIAFLMGSIPFGVIYSFFRGVDIRSISSGNIGATNVSRLFGFWKGFVPVFILDFLKAVIPILLFRIVISSPDNINLFEIFQMLIGTASVLGHNFSIFLNFKGGKGVASAAGVMTVLVPYISILCFTVFLLVYFTFGKRIVGRCSIATAVVGPIFSLIIPGIHPILITMIFLFSVAILTSHRKNIREWISGEDLLKKQQEKKLSSRN